MTIERKSERPIEKLNNRTDESRYSEERLKHVRNNIHMATRDPFYISPEKIPPGIDFYWCRVNIFRDGTEPDYSRLAEMMDKGWDPVSIERFPEFRVMDMMPTTRGKLETSVTRLGHVLVERPTFLGKEEWQALTTQISRSLETIPYTDGQSYSGGLKKTDWRSFRGSDQFAFD